MAVPAIANFQAPLLPDRDRINTSLQKVTTALTKGPPTFLTVGSRPEKPPARHPPMNTSPIPETSPLSCPANAAQANKTPKLRRPNPGWRWVFLCAEAALFTLSVVSVVKGPYLHSDDHPNLAEIVATVFFLTTVFLLFVSPFFFRRLGWLAVFSWLNALAVSVGASLPVF